ncbi:hypothetical protein C8R44DRAFT_756729 [Mycena epipterygia]|nr:hypothetical protein C8R44DRAFT_756729 [Mycena epipterygia]
MDELGRMLPKFSVKNAKGTMKYIHDLKESEARSKEQWRLEKMIMEQAMGELQVQFDKIRCMWKEERMNRQRAEEELQLNETVPGGGSATDQSGS